MKSVCFTGHRNVKVTNELVVLLNEILTSLIANGAVTFIAGGANGFDELAAKTVIKLREEYPHIKLHLVLPCSSEEQTAKWNDMQKSEYQKILKSVDKVEHTSNNYYDGCMKVRNARLVELADCCVCYYKNRSRSGTGQTIRMAVSKGIRIINLAEMLWRKIDLYMFTPTLQLYNAVAWKYEFSCTHFLFTPIVNSYEKHVLLSVKNTLKFNILSIQKVIFENFIALVNKINRYFSTYFYKHLV